MTVSEWTVSDWTTLGAGVAGVYLLWQQNRIFERQNDIFTRQAGHIAPPPNTSQMPWIGRYWPTMVMVGLMALTGYDIYARHGAPSIIPWWFYLLLLLIVTVIGAVTARLAMTRTVGSPDKPKEPSRLVIHSANYRAWRGGGNTYDVTEFLRKMISGDSLVFTIENHNFVFGDHNFVPVDPLAGQVKRLRVTYSYMGDPASTIERFEHDRLVLPEDSQNQRLTGEVGRLINTNASLGQEIQDWKGKCLAENIDKTNFQKELARAEVRATELQAKLSKSPGSLSESIDQLVAEADQFVAPKVVKLADQVEYDGSADYPLKLRMQLRNDSAGPIDVQMKEYRPKLISGSRKMFASEVLQLRLAGGWHPQPHGVSRIAVSESQQFQAWVGLDEQRLNKSQVEENRGDIGTLILLVNGQDVSIQL